MHPAPTLAPGDVIVLADERDALVTALLDIHVGELAGLLESRLLRPKERTRMGHAATKNSTFPVLAGACPSGSKTSCLASSPCRSSGGVCRHRETQDAVTLVVGVELAKPPRIEARELEATGTNRRVS